MRQTTNYQLPSWDSDDRILRTDFNDLTEKVDTALAEKLGTVRIIKTVQAASSTKFDIDLTDIDWSKWSVVGFTLDLLTAGSQEIQSVYCQVETDIAGGVKEYCSQESNGYLVMVTYMPSLVMLLPLKDPERRVQSAYLGGTSGVGFAACTFQDLNALRVGAFGGRSFTSSQSVTVWGIP